MPENLVSRDGFSRPVPRQPAHLHTQAESGAYLRDSFRVPWRRPFMKPPYAIGSVPSLSGHAIAYRWRSLPRVRQHRASSPQGSSERVLPWQVTMDQLIFASLSHAHYWYEVGMLKVLWAPLGLGAKTSAQKEGKEAQFLIGLIDGTIILHRFTYILLILVNLFNFSKEGWDNFLSIFFIYLPVLVFLYSIFCLWLSFRV